MSSSPYTPTDNQGQRTQMRLALPSKGRMEDETRAFLRECGLSVNKINPRQYVAEIPEIPGLEVWFQRSAMSSAKCGMGM